MNNFFISKIIKFFENVARYWISKKQFVLGTDQKRAEVYLKQIVGNSQACFHPGQWEAINALVNLKKTLLIIERTGWGKSSVYFISTRLLRERGAGLTLIFSPLLALMRNQILAAERLGVKAVSIDSSNQNDWLIIQQLILADQIDALLIAPERLANQSFVKNILMPVAPRIGLIVVDEAHCISEWGHDFRPDYQLLSYLLRHVPADIPVLGTTATANQRVIADIRKQFGKIKIKRGSLTRTSLMLQNMILPEQASRLAWLAQYLPTLPGTGIIYVLTTYDARQVTAWLKTRGIIARAYYNGVIDSRFASSDDYRQRLENALLNNELKVLVATTALGMGYDKPDLGFVIHYQAPGSVIAYYQQVGRAGRSIDNAYGILLSGEEEAKIHAYFRKHAFPTEENIQQILNLLNNNNGLTIDDFAIKLNLRHAVIEKTLKILSAQDPAPIIRKEQLWYKTVSSCQDNRKQMRRILAQREQEWHEMQRYMRWDRCLMAYLRDALDDALVEPCGRCANCQQKTIVGIQIDPDVIRDAQDFLDNSLLVLEPKNQAPPNAFVRDQLHNICSTQLCAEPGRILAHWGHVGWGKMVQEDKYAGYFRDELVIASADLILQSWRPNPHPQWVTCVPSQLHPELVSDFASRLAQRLKLRFIKVLIKQRANEPQKKQQNEFYQCRNLDGAFAVMTERVLSTPVLLIDDITDSGWTMAVLAALLRRAGSGPVFPFALAVTMTRD